MFDEFTPGRRSRVAVAQMTSTSDVKANLTQVERLCRAASVAKCVALFLPEGFAKISSNGAESARTAEPLDGDTLRSCVRFAKRHNLWLSLGGLGVALREDEIEPEDVDELGNVRRRWNAHVLLTPEGKIHRQVYRKTHLFDHGSMRESAYTKPGSGALTSHRTPFGCVGVSICYDVRFPDVFQALRYEHGAEIMIVPSAFTKPTGKAHWEVLLRARAIETQSYVIAAAQTGKHNADRESYGHAMIVDPWGNVVAEMKGEVGIAVAEISLDLVDEVRRKMPLDRHRRPVRRESFLRVD
jgi:predicted amidohydrolase